MYRCIMHVGIYFFNDFYENSFISKNIERHEKKILEHKNVTSLTFRYLENRNFLLQFVYVQAGFSINFGQKKKFVGLPIRDFRGPRSCPHTVFNVTPWDHTALKTNARTLRYPVYMTSIDEQRTRKHSVLVTASEWHKTYDIMNGFVSNGESTIEYRVRRTTNDLRRGVFAETTAVNTYAVSNEYAFAYRFCLSVEMYTILYVPRSRGVCVARLYEVWRPKIIRP